MLKVRNERDWEFPGGALVKTALSLPRVQVQSLIRELRSHKPHGAIRKKKKRNKKKVEEKEKGLKQLRLKA